MEEEQEQTLLLLDPPKLFTRIAQVERVSFFSPELDFIFLDGESDDTDIYRGTVAFGSPDIKTTIMSSAACVGKGDRVVVLIDVDNLYVVSKLDTYEYMNNNRTALYPENILLDVLNTLCINTYCKEDELSYAEFVDASAETPVITRIQCEAPNEETNRIPYRLLYWLSRMSLENNNMVHVDSGSWPHESAGGGILPTQPIGINDTIRHGIRINHMPYVVDMPFGQSTYEGDLSIYSDVLTNLDMAKCHPSVADTIDNFYEGSTVIWFDDPDPEWVLVIGVYSAWDSTKQIKFLEVPVYGWSERARNDDENEDVITDGSDRACYLRREDLVRDVYTLSRSWVEWNIFEMSGDFSEALHRALAIPAVRTDIDEWSFAIHDGYGYATGSEVYGGANRQRLIYGRISRSINENGVASNGSPYIYDIVHDDPASGAAKVNLFYETTFKYYDDNAGDEWESQKSTASCLAREWVVLTNGTDKLFKKINIDYLTQGGYAQYPYQESGEWQGDSSGLEDVENIFQEFVYWNSEDFLVCTYDYVFTYDETSHTFEVIQSIPVFHYANIEIGLFVIEYIETTVTNLLGPGADLTSGSRHRKFVVWAQGAEFVLFDVDSPYDIGTDKFPTIFNFWPWINDANMPQKPETAPFNTSEDYDGLFFFKPFANYYEDPLEPYAYDASSYPSMQNDVSTELFACMKDYTAPAFKSDYLQIFLDPITDSWSIKIKNILEIASPRTISFPDGGGDTSEWSHGTNTLIKLGSGSPTFTKPGVGVTINI